MFYMNIIFKDGDEFEMSEQHLKPMFSNNLEELEKIKKDIELSFSKKNKNKKKQIYFYINDVNIVDNQSVNDAKKSMKNFFSL